MEIYTIDGLCKRLGIDNPWPEERPNVPTDNHNWFVNDRALGDCLESSYLIIELGAWLGGSTRFLAERSAFVITIDHWMGSLNQRGPERTDIRDKLPNLNDTFLTNCWHLRHKILPLRMSTHQGMALLHSHRLVPDLVYIDADHSYEGCTKDIEDAVQFGNNTVITGDDWAFGSDREVRSAVVDFAKRHRMRVYGAGNFWRLYHGTGASPVMTRREKALADMEGILPAVYDSWLRQRLIPSNTKRYEFVRILVTPILKMLRQSKKQVKKRVAKALFPGGR